mgnify:CR=1 FL=1
MPDTVITVGGDIRDLQTKFNQAGNEVTKLGKKVKTLHRHYHIPCSNTAIGHIVLEPEE